MTEETPLSMSRRTAIKHGVLSTGVLAGATGSADADAEEAAAETTRGTSADALDGLVFPYQFRPGRTVTVADADLEWRPTGVPASYRTQVVSYAASRSYRALLFTDADAPLEVGETVAFGPGRAPAVETDRSYVGVDVRRDP